MLFAEPKVFKQDIKDNKRPQDDKIDNPELGDAIAVFFGLLTLLVLFTVVMIRILGRPKDTGIQ